MKALFSMILLLVGSFANANNLNLSYSTGDYSLYGDLNGTYQSSGGVASIEYESVLSPHFTSSYGVNAGVGDSNMSLITVEKGYYAYLADVNGTSWLNLRLGVALQAGQGTFTSATTSTNSKIPDKNDGVAGGSAQADLILNLSKSIKLGVGAKWLGVNGSSWNIESTQVRGLVQFSY